MMGHVALLAEPLLNGYNIMLNPRTRAAGRSYLHQCPPPLPLKPYCSLQKVLNLLASDLYVMDATRENFPHMVVFLGLWAYTKVRNKLH